MNKLKIVFRYSSNKNGITLVSLVITIIILIILSTVTITAVLGDRGLIDQAQQTKNLADSSIEHEDENMNHLSQEYANLRMEDIEIEKITIVDYKKSGEVFDKKTTVEDEVGNKITVPEGFKIAPDSGDTVEQGVVIEDVNASTDKNVQGSQYVWIPTGQFKKDNGELSNEIILGRYTFDENNGTPHMVQNAEDYTNQSDNIFIESIYKELVEYREGIASERLDGLNATAKGLGTFIGSVKLNGGYYIGRYEASYASGSTSTSTVSDYSVCKAASKISTSFSNSMIYNPGTLWNNISQLNASKVAINTYANSGSVISDLPSSYAWDTAIVYIQEAGNTNYANQDGQSINSTLTNTGTKQDEVCKINDLSSNIEEWTTEYSSYTRGTSAFPCILRGGYYGSGSRSPSYRGAGNSYSGYFEGGGFRICLYL